MWGNKRVWFSDEIFGNILWHLFKLFVINDPKMLIFRNDISLTSQCSKMNLIFSDWNICRQQTNSRISWQKWRTKLLEMDWTGHCLHNSIVHFQVTPSVMPLLLWLDTHNQWGQAAFKNYLCIKGRLTKEWWLKSRHWLKYSIYTHTTVNFYAAIFQ